MDPRLLTAYNEELLYLRESAREFGEEHEAEAGRLGLNTPDDPDPYVERLLEGVAFLSARVNLKIQDQFPEFTQHMLQAIQPHYLAPTPAVCIVGVEPQDTDPAIVDGYPIPRLSELNATANGPGGATVTFRTAHDVTLWPLKIVEAEYLPSRVSVAAHAVAAGVRAEAGLRVRFAATGGVPLNKIRPEQLPVYLAGSDGVPGELYRQLAGETLAVVAQSVESASGPKGWLSLPTPEPLGFEEDCALLPAELRSFRGYRLLSEYFMCPERFNFVQFSQLNKIFEVSTQTCDVVFLFKRSSPALVGAVAASNLRLFSTPAINLFEKQLDRVQISPFKHEHLVNPDRTRPLEFEVYRVLEVKAFSRSNPDPRPVAPLYAYGALLYDWREALFYVTRLRQRRLSTKEQRLRGRSDYIGTETWIALTSPGDARRLDDVHELGVRALVTNRELTEQLRFGSSTNLTMNGVPARAITMLRAPTRPRPPLGLTDSPWRVIAHLTPNYATLAPQDHEDPSVLRDHLALYGRTDDASMRRQVDGVLSVRAQPVTRRLPGQDRLAFARGLQIRLKLDDAAFEHGRLFLFSAVLERFLAEFSAINSFTECVFETQNEGTYAKWPPRTGRRRNI